MKTITEREYKEAVAASEAAQKVVIQFHHQQSQSFEDRWKRFEENKDFFTDAELVYSAGARCEACGAGLAYPKVATIHHKWDCSALLKGEGKPECKGGYPFAFYSIKSEDQPSANGATTRPK